jgi:hypothetical protein
MDWRVSEVREPAGLNKLSRSRTFLRICSFLAIDCKYKSTLEFEDRLSGETGLGTSSPSPLSVLSLLKFSPELVEKLLERDSTNGGSSLSDSDEAVYGL